jgi:segregation and condensation protein B
VVEAIVYVAEEPLTAAQIGAALLQPVDRVQQALTWLMEEFDKPEHGVAIREVAGGYKMATKAEHHDAVRTFVKSLKPPLKLSLPALETLAVVAYKQPATAPEIMEIRGVQGAGVLKTLLDRKLIAAAGRKNVIGKPILYKTTKEFLIQFGLKDLSELPSLKEFEEIRRMAFADSEPAAEPRQRNRRRRSRRWLNPRPAESVARIRRSRTRGARTRGRRTRGGRGTRSSGRRRRAAFRRQLMAEERLQKILAHAGVASRRHAEQLITEGRVWVNGARSPNSAPKPTWSATTSRWMASCCTRPSAWSTLRCTSRTTPSPR